MKKKFFIALTTFTIASMMCSCQTSTSQNSVIPVSQSNIEISKVSNDISEKNIETKIDDILDGNLTGFVFVVKDGESVYSKGFNKGDDHQQFSSDTVFRIGSDTKQFTATGIMLLQEQGKLSVNDTLDKYFPEYSHGKEITLHNLLSMHSGLTDYSDYFAQLNLTVDNEAQNKANILQFILDADLISKPNEIFQYNNSNYFLLAEIIERVSGMTYEEYITENIFKPLDMKSTGIYKNYEKDGAVIAKPLYPTGAEDDFNKPGATFGAGDIMSNADDLAKWLKAFEGGSILSDESIKAVSTSYSTENDSYEYGYGWFISNNGIYHGGNISEYSAMLFTSPEEKYSIIILSNEISGNLANLSTAIRYELF